MHPCKNLLASTYETRVIARKRTFHGYGILANELMITRIQGASLMAKRVFGTVAILAFILCPPSVRSDDSSLPENLLGFLKPGMHLMEKKDSD